MTCPECQAELPEGTAFRTGGSLWLPDYRTLDCPFCGAPLEPIGWRHLATLALVLAVVLAARRLITPWLEFLDWTVLAAICVLVVAYHVREIVRWRRSRNGQGDRNG